ncbi:MAG: hypothetical protein EZS28_016086 [Streblomastix strix]|uniref:Uncharacterized protein n=1 Tax=Streblomastix strix TaxID=222440 RepID=A0A5J4W0I3_9EUKA|nr:MAG: hypothetical protein EZS28_016086 [Streblomastix strix]
MNVNNLEDTDNENIKFHNTNPKYLMDIQEKQSFGGKKVLSDAINPILEKHGKIPHQSDKQQQAPSSSSTVSKQLKKGNKKEENKKKGKKDESDSSDNSEL